MAQMSRRDFLKGSAAGAVAGLAVGAGGVALIKPSAGKEPSLPETWDTEADVVIVGAGGAGLAAALGAESAKAGKILVLEKLSEVLSCSTAICGGFITFCGTDLQKKFGIEDSNDLFYEDIVNYGQSVVPEVVRVYVDNQLAYYDLIRSLNVPFVDSVSPSPGCSVPRTHTVDPAKHVMILEKTARDRGVEIKFNTTGQRLLTNCAGEVIGLEATTKDKTTYIKANKAVIMATGGFTHNAEMLNECIPGLGNVMALSCPGHTAEGHRAVFQLGGQFSGRPTIYSVQGMHPSSRTMEGYAELFLYGAIEVNMEGARHINEDEYWSNRRTRSTLEQPLRDGIPILYQIIDQKGYEKAVEAGPPIGLGPKTIELLVKADSIEELAEKLGLPKLKETVDKYNADIDAVGYDTVFGRKTMVGVGTPKIEKLDTPPFYAFENTAWLAYNPTVSFKVDASLHAVDQYGKAIPRLYLVGEIMLRCVVGDHYMYGLATGAGGALGYYAGKLAAAEKPWA